MALTLDAKYTNTRTKISMGTGPAGAWREWTNLPVQKGDHITIELTVKRDGAAAPGVRLRFYRWDEVSGYAEHTNIIPTTDANGKAVVDYVVNVSAFNDEPNPHKIYTWETYV